MITHRRHLVAACRALARRDNTKRARQRGAVFLEALGVVGTMFALVGFGSQVYLKQVHKIQKYGATSFRVWEAAMTTCDGSSPAVLSQANAMSQTRPFSKGMARYLEQTQPTIGRAWGERAPVVPCAQRGNGELAEGSEVSRLRPIITKGIRR